MKDTIKFLGFIVPNGVADETKKGSDSILLNVSICFFINKDYKGLNPDNQQGPDNYNSFYDDLQRLKAIGPAVIKIDNENPPVTSPLFLVGNEAEDIVKAKDDGLKNLLWNIIFPYDRYVNNKSLVPKYTIGEISNLFGENHDRLEPLHNFLNKHADGFVPIGLQDDNLDFHAADTLEKIQAYGFQQLKASYTANIDFLRRTDHGQAVINNVKNYIATYQGNGVIAKPLNEFINNYYADLIDLRTKAITSYLHADGDHNLKIPLTRTSIKGPIDIDEVINNYSSVSHEPTLMRLMGLVHDYQITVLRTKIKNGAFILEFSLPSNPFDFSTIIQPIKTRVKIIEKAGKFAFLVDDTKLPSKDDPKFSSYYRNSLLLNAPIINGSVEKGVMSFVRADKMAIAQKLKDREKKLKENGVIANDDLGDALTRGVLLTHKYLPKVIAPAILTDKIINDGITDDFAARGHRIGLFIKNKKNELYSLTKRDLVVRSDNGKTDIFVSKQHEGCITFDTPSQYMENGEIKSISSDVITEYSGELLSLKSAFRMGNKTDKAQSTIDKFRIVHDSGLFKSQARFEQPISLDTVNYNKAISFFHFPYKAKQTASSFLGVYYNVPASYNIDHSPKLRFGNNYSMIVSQEYLNGWGMPLNSLGNDSFQLSIEELVSGPNELNSDYSPDWILFEPLERKKALDLFPRNSISDDPNLPISDRASLLHLIVRSENGRSTKQLIDERHLLPPKIDIEPAYWHNIISPPKIDALTSFNLKRRANCKFADESAFTKYTSEKDKEGKYKKCHEDCENYCGGTQMESHYTESHIFPRYLCDPTIIGGSLTFYFDQDCTPGLEEINLNGGSFSFGGEPGLSPKSYLLRASGAAAESYNTNHTFREIFEVNIKKGAQLFAQITGIPTAEAIAALKNGWWKDLQRTLTDDESELIRATSNVPKKISFTHAVKEPLFEPKIMQLGSVPNDYDTIRHIERYLGKPPYVHYLISKNIIAARADNPATKQRINSNIVFVDLIAHFERLDAIKKIQFLQSVIPTGGLELWMRREVYIDDPEQIVLNEGSVINHIPSDPILPFNNYKNTFQLEYRIEFSSDIMSQLKNLGNVETKDDIDDIFKAIVSTLHLKYDIKSNIFEEREYYLKDISKFRGFFEDQRFVGQENAGALTALENYVLPKINDVMSHLERASDLRFKVMTLNNRLPGTPSVAFAITTIQEYRSHADHKETSSTQKGNIVTIYLNRGRLSSGKDERIGIIVDDNTDYNLLFKQNNLISKAGKDILTDRFENQNIYLTPETVVIPKENEYEAAYDSDLGIYHYLPKFDIEKQLWKFEVELNIVTAGGKQMHNPFINFSLVHFQPFSINYNRKGKASTLNDLKNDCRISGTENTAWCYLLPERKLSVYFDKPCFFGSYGSVNLTISFDYESLNFLYFQETSTSEDNNYKVRNNFIVTVQGSDDGVKWINLHSSENEFEASDSNGKINPVFHHPLLNSKVLAEKENQTSIKLNFSKWANPFDRHNSEIYRTYRVRFIEVEWLLTKTWEELLKDNSELLKSDPQTNEVMKIRYVELIY